MIRDRRRSCFTCFALLSLFTFGVSMGIAGDYSARGTGEPPFLSYGTESNLLMLIDNSGSMLDTAYIDEDTDGAEGADTQTNCFDDNYLPLDLSNDVLYAGPFPVYKEVDDDGNPDTPAVKQELWYKWTSSETPPVSVPANEEMVPLWEHKTYAVGDRVYENGIIYEAASVAGASTGANIYEDDNVDWVAVNRPIWKDATVYHAETFIYNNEDGLLYYTAEGGTSAGTTLDEDKWVKWLEIPVYQNGMAYRKGDYVVWENVLYQANNDGTSNGSNPWKDQNVFWVETNPFQWKCAREYALGDIVTYDGLVFEARKTHVSGVCSAVSVIYKDDFVNNWKRLDQGYYQELTQTEAKTFCSSGAGSQYSANGLCFAQDTSVTPVRVTAFAASGNFLNWLMASKFDIQKSILTGGKYNPDIDRLISENRGCSGSRFIKQVTLDNGAGYLTLAVRGPRTEGDPNRMDRVDQIDDTTRVEVLGVSTTGYDPSSCQEAIDRIFTHGLNGAQQEIDSCLAGTGSTADARTALNHAMQYCWQDNHTRNLNTLVMDCETVYAGLEPGDIANYSNAYNCYGIFDADRVHDENRTGYTGRCYAPAVSATGATCEPYTKIQAECDWTSPSKGDPCEWGIDSDGDGKFEQLFRNSSTSVYREYCTAIAEDGTSCRNHRKWDIYRIDSITKNQCSPDDPAYAGVDSIPAGWSRDIDGVQGFSADDTALLPAPLPIMNNTGYSDEIAYCFYEAMEDYCADLQVPEVIDPTDQETSTSGDYGNIPALLVDSGVLNQLGVDVPMNVMAGHIKITSKEISPPRGILQENATELRLGAMAFNKAGAYTECQTANTTDLIVEYCPQTNRDGAQLITPVRKGSQISSFSGQLHVDDLATAINAVRAASWTPLAEAVYNAIGYYTQNIDMRLNDGDFQTDADVLLGWRDGHYYAPGSYVYDGGALFKTDRGGISIGGAVGPSLATDTGVTWGKTASFKGVWMDGTTYQANDIVLHGGKFYFTPIGGISTLKAEADPTHRNAPLLDTVLPWEFLIDPVVNYCQDNNILIITEGASTADINEQVERFALGTHSFNTTAIVDSPETTADPTVSGQCSDGLKGSSYVDDLSFFANNANDQFVLYPAGNDTLPQTDFPFDEETKSSITTYVVSSGVLRDNNTQDECNPAYLVDRVAKNGGTSGVLKGENPSQLETQLLAIFNELRQRASAGSAASVISSARGGEGAIYQAIFWPELLPPTGYGDEYTVEWAGDVHGLFLAQNGNMYEDTDMNRQLNPSENLDNDMLLGVPHLDCGEDLDCNGIRDPGEVDIDQDGILDLHEDLNGNGIFDLNIDFDGDGIFESEDIDGDNHFDRDTEDGYWNASQKNGTIDGVDLRVIFFYDKDQAQPRTRICWNTSVIDSLGTSCTNPAEMNEIHYLWSANQWLSDYPVVGGSDPLDVLRNRGDELEAFNSVSRKRYIFTWNDDLDGDGLTDGKVGIGEVVPFVPGAALDPVAFDVADTAAVDEIVKWMRGQDFPGVDTDNDGVYEVPPLRSRQSILRVPDLSGTLHDYSITWRLGDVIHSTPMTVTSPAEGYHYIYNDSSYGRFLSRWANRRHMIYFGANDGMLHAVNGGFYNPLEKKFYLDYDVSTMNYSDTGPALGAEMWAYVPYNLQPHLKYLMNPLYTHKYYVDLRPRIFDVQIFEEEPECTSIGLQSDQCKHPQGWGTILVGGMRFGGAPIAGKELTGSPLGDTRLFKSSFFILDITDPENPPILLGEMTHDTTGKLASLGYTTAVPSMIVMKGKDGTGIAVNEWYLVFGSGPHGKDALKGVSDQEATVSVFPLSGLANDPPVALRIPATDPRTTIGAVSGTFPIYDGNGQPLINAFVSDPITIDFDINPSYKEYKADAVYFGTIEGEQVDPINDPIGFSTYADGTTYWNGGGRMYRLVMEPWGKVVGDSGGDPVTTPDQWDIKPLLNLGSEVDALNTKIIPEIPGHPIQPISAPVSVGTDLYNFWVYFGTGRFFDADDKTDRQQQSYYGIKEPMTIVSDSVESSGRRNLTWDEVELAQTMPGVYGEKGLVDVEQILVGESPPDKLSPLTCMDPATGLELSGDYGCISWLDSGDYYFGRMERYIAGNSICINSNCPKPAGCFGSNYSDPDYKNNCVDGWKKDFWPYTNRERNIGQATLLGGLTTFTTYRPNSGVCEAEGNAYLYGVYYRTGTSWYENIFGEYGIGKSGEVLNKLDLGRGLATTPNLFTSESDDEGAKAFVQTSTGEIKEIRQDNLPIQNHTSGKTGWLEYRRP